MKCIKKILKIFAIIIIIVLSIPFCVIFLFLCIKGYRLIIDPLFYTDLVAIGVIQWFEAFVAIFIPVLIFYLSNSIKSNVDNISKKTISSIKRVSAQNVTPSSDYYSSAIEGTVIFDYSNNNGRYIIGQDELMFEVMFSKASDTNIYVYNDPSTISTIALVKNASNIKAILNANEYDTSSRARCPKINQIVVLKNIHGFFAAIKILDIKDDTRGAIIDEVKFEYIIQANGSSNFIND